MSKRLVDLDPHWLGAGGEGITRNGRPVPERHGVGVTFDCPCGCGTRCAIEFNNPLDGGPPHDPTRNLWDRTGDTFEALTLSPSILRMERDGCGWHGFIRDGGIITC